MAGLQLLNTKSSIICIVALGLYLSRWVIWQLTVGANRRRMIRENGCKSVQHFQHQGLLGKLFGLDFVRASMAATKAKRHHEMFRTTIYATSNSIAVTALNKELFFTCEPANVKTILSTGFADWSVGHVRQSVISPICGNGIFTSDGHAWERSRALIRPSFARHQVADLESLEKHVQNLISRIPIDGSTFDLQELFFALTMDSATEFLFGRSTYQLVPSMANKDAAQFIEAFTFATEQMARDFRSQGLNKFIPNKRRTEATQMIRKFAIDIVNEAIVNEKELRLNSKQSYIFLQELLKQTTDKETIISETLNVLLAGRDTTAGLLSHTFFELARRPDIWVRLQAEIDQELHGKPPDFEGLKSLKYVRWVINESLRLRPVVPSNGRVSIRDTILPVGGGPDGKSPIFIPAGKYCLWSVWSMHRREDFYGPEALEFKPERWQDLRTGWEYLPFSGGPRVCIGQNFALTEAAYTLVRLVQTFKRIEPRDPRPWCEQSTLTLAVGNGVQVGMTQY